MKKFTKRFLSVISAAALVATTALSAVASSGHSHSGGHDLGTVSDPKYTITLTGGETEAEKHFGAYQIFTGSYDETKPGQLTDIKFGNAFGDVADEDTSHSEYNKTAWQTKINNFVYALATAPTTGAGNEQFEKFTDFRSFAGATKDTLADEYYLDTANKTPANIDFDRLAVDVADVLSKHTSADDRLWLQVFTDILGGYGQGTGGYLQKGFLAQYYEGEEKGDNYEIGVPESGYYLVRDLSAIVEDAESDDSKAFSARMLMVVGDITQVIKSDVPTLTKEIERDDDNYYDTEAAGVGDTVHFRLTGTLPQNYDRYIGGYIYNFTDSVSKGLTIDEKTVKVTAKGAWEVVTDTLGATTYTWNPDIVLEISDTYYTVDKVDNEEVTVSGTTTEERETLHVDFDNLKDVEVTVDGKNYILGYYLSATGGLVSGYTDPLADNLKSSKIYVDYDVKVTGEAVVGTTGNTNLARIQYSDNPASHDDTDYTTLSEATVYTFGLNLFKADAAGLIDGLDNAIIKLANVNFALLRPSSKGTANKYDIAKFDVESGDVEIVSWDEDAIEIIPDTTTDEQIRQAIIKYNTDNAGLFIIKTDTNGDLNIAGLNDETTYTLVETATKDDTYAYIDPFTFNLTAAKKTDSEEYSGALEKLTLDDHQVDPDNKHAISSEKYVIDTTTNDNMGKGQADITVANFKYVDLPSTGGIGVYIYYIAGGCVLVAAAVLFYLSSRKKSGKKSA